MPTIKNKSGRMLVINLPDDKNVCLLARGTAKVSEEDLSAPQTKRYLASRSIVVLKEAKRKDAKPKKKGGN